MIDWIRIDELRDEVGQDDFGDIVGVFFEEVQERFKSAASRYCCYAFGSVAFSAGQRP